MMDIFGFTVERVNGHLMLYMNGKFKCSGDNEEEIEEEKRLLLGR